VLIVACPCALALAKPLTAAAGLGAAARRGLLFRSADALLETARVDVVALDKTGTVTEGAVEIASASDHDVRVAAGLERYSRHPIAIAVIREAIARGLALPAATDVREEAGAGISGRVDGTPWRLRSGGADVVVLEGPNGYRGLIRIGDRVRDDSRRAVGALRALGAYVVLLSGDDAEPTGRIAEAIGASEWWADQRPAEKARRIEAWRQEGRMVLLAGDGMNDGPALAAADIGVAMGTGAASSIMTADAVLGVGSIQPLVAGVRVSRVCRDAVRANQIRSVVYNVLAVSAAAAGWVNPLVAAVLMPLSSAMVVAGAGRVERRVRALERA
jgi:cation transport ATPase